MLNFLFFGLLLSAPIQGYKLPMMKDQRVMVLMDKRKSIAQLSPNELIAELEHSVGSAIDERVKSAMLARKFAGALLLKSDELFLKEYLNVDRASCLVLLSGLEQLKAQENMDAKKAAKIARTREITAVVPCEDGQTEMRLHFTNQGAFQTFLTSYNLQCLAKKYPLYLVPIFDYENLINGESYVGILQAGKTGVMDPVKEIEGILDAVRSKADFAASRALSKAFETDVKFVCHDYTIYKPNSKDIAGDVDSLFTSADTDYLMERKRTVNDEVLDQIVRIRDAYKFKLKMEGKEDRKER